jgi:hypothetical protein
MRLLTAHKILVVAFLILSVVLVVWGVGHRSLPNAWVAIVIGAGVLPFGLLYLRKLYRSPPIK